MTSTASAILSQPKSSAAAFAAALDDALATLSSGGGDRLRVWSVVVTLFGDAVTMRGGVLRLSAIQEVTDRLGLEPGALRTAMSRLARDGWLTRDRRGRASFYALTPEKLAETQAASARIYAAGPKPWDGSWTVALATAATAAERETLNATLAARGFGRAGSDAWLRPRTGEPPALDGVSFFECRPGAAAVDPALTAEIWSDSVAAERFRGLIALAEPMTRALDAGASQAPLDAAAARCLLLHQWRRAVLRAGDVPAELRPEDWPGEEARAVVKRLYWRLAPASEAWLDACDGAPEGALPPAAPGMASRFGGQT